MNRFENRIELEKLQAALTIVIDNDIIIPYIEQKRGLFIKNKTIWVHLAL